MRIALTIERLKRNETQKTIAEKIGITSQMLSAYELGKTAPSLETMLKISKFYEKPVEELFAVEVDNHE